MLPTRCPLSIQVTLPRMPYLRLDPERDLEPRLSTFEVATSFARR
jgi:hypothetical protein